MLKFQLDRSYEPRLNLRLSPPVRETQGATERMPVVFVPVLERLGRRHGVAFYRQGLTIETQGDCRP
jgi:hypothetical protein